MGRRSWRFGLEPAINRDQHADQQDPADQQPPLADESPPVAEPGIDDEGAEEAHDGQHDNGENVGPADFCSRDLDPSCQANTDTQQYRREYVDQATDDQTHAEAGRRGIDDASGRDGRRRRRLLTVRRWAKPAGCARRREESRSKVRAVSNDYWSIRWWVARACC